MNSWTNKETGINKKVIVVVLWLRVIVCLCVCVCVCECLYELPQWKLCVWVFGDVTVTKWRLMNENVCLSIYEATTIMRLVQDKKENKQV